MRKWSGRRAVTFLSSGRIETVITVKASVSNLGSTWLYMKKRGVCIEAAKEVEVCS